MSNEIVEQKNTAISARAAVTPMDMLNMAMQQGADLDKMQQLMDMQERWEKNEAKKAYIKSMSMFRAQCPTITKTRKAHNSMYAGLAETIGAIKDILSAFGLSHSWRTNQENGQITVTCCVTHELGHSECTSMTAGADSSGSKNAIQAIGSTVTYLQRYTLYAILGLASGDQDDDGNCANVQLISEEQVNNIYSMISDNDLNMDKFMSWVKRTLKVGAIEEINVAGYDMAIVAINATIKNKGGK